MLAGNSLKYYTACTGSSDAAVSGLHSMAEQHIQQCELAPHLFAGVRCCAGASRPFGRL